MYALCHRTAFKQSPHAHVATIICNAGRCALSNMYTWRPRMSVYAGWHPRPESKCVCTMPEGTQWRVSVYISGNAHVTTNMLHVVKSLMSIAMSVMQTQSNRLAAKMVTRRQTADHYCFCEVASCTPLASIECPRYSTEDLTNQHFFCL